MNTIKLARELLEMAEAHTDISHYPTCSCKDVVERMAKKLDAWREEVRKQTQLRIPHVSTTRDLEDWFEHIDRTAQITYRIKLRPAYLVRIVKDPERHEESVTRMYVQAVGDTLGEAFERCLEAYLKDGWVAEELTGHKGSKLIESAP